MKTDRYTKCVLTVIAICLVLICLRDIRIASAAYAQQPTQRAGPQSVKIVGLSEDFKDGLPVNINWYSDQLVTSALPVRCQ